MFLYALLTCIKFRENKNQITFFFHVFLQEQIIIKGSLYEKYELGTLKEVRILYGNISSNDVLIVMKKFIVCLRNVCNASALFRKFILYAPHIFIFLLLLLSTLANIIAVRLERIHSTQHNTTEL